MTINLQENLTGTTGNDNFVLSQNYTDYSRVDLGPGYDTVKYADGENRLVVNNVEHIIGGYGWNNYATIYQLPKEVLFTNLDGVILGTLLNGNKITFEYNLDEPIFPNSLYCAVSTSSNMAYVSGAGEIQGNAGIDTFYLFGENNDTRIRLVENIYGGAGNDIVTISEQLSLTTKIDLGEGHDTLRLIQFTNTPESTNKNIGKVSGAEEILGSSASYDDIYLDGKLNTTLLTNIDKLTGSSGHDTVTFATTYKNMLDMGNGTDKVILNGLDNSINLYNTESLIGGAGKDSIVLKTISNKGTFDLKEGIDGLYFGNFKNIANVSGAEIIVGGTNVDTINLFGSNVSTISKIENINGGIGSDNIILKDALTNLMTINLGNGFDTLTLSNIDNIGKISGAEVLNGGTAKDYITLTGIANTIEITGIEQIKGSEGKDTVTVNDNYFGSIDLAGGYDKIILNGDASNGINLYNVEAIVGSKNADSINIKTAIIDGIFDLKDGIDTVKLGDYNNTATFYRTEKIYAGSGNDIIDFGSENSSMINLGTGIDTLNLIDFNSTVLLYGIENLSGGNTSSKVVLGDASDINVSDFQGILTGSAYNDIIDFSNVSSSRINGGKGDDIISLSIDNQIDIVSFDLDSGKDSIYNFDSTIDKLSFSNKNNISVDTNNKTISNEGIVFANYDDSTSNILISFNYSQDTVSLIGVDNFNSQMLFFA